MVNNDRCELGADWRDHIPGTMGSVDKIFSGHPLDKERAFDLLTKLRKEQIGFLEVENAFRRHLEEEGCRSQYAEEQLQKIRDHYRPWLND